MSLPTQLLLQKRIGISQAHYIGAFAILCLLSLTACAMVSTTLAVLILVIGTAFGYFCYLADNQTLGFSFTATHMQQHCLKGGWSLRWHNIERVGECFYQIQGWQTDVPWIGLALKEPHQLVDSISPKLITQMVLEQRQALYLGLKQQQRLDEFQDLLLKESPVVLANGRTYRGLQAMLLHRMKIQREVWGYDLLISTSDLVTDKASFMGMVRRYLAASYQARPTTNDDTSS